MKKTINEIGEKFKEFGSDNDNELLIIGLISILVFIWMIVYLIPNIFINLFNTFLGKIILILILMFVSFKNLNYGIILLLIFIILYRILSLSVTNSEIKEGFTWNQTSRNNFLDIQKLINPKIVFDTSEIQKQASQEEVNYFNQYGYWPWSDEVIKLYKETLDTNPYVRTSPQDAINTTRTIYNEKSILELLSWQSKEGRFLLNGVSIYDGKENPYVALPSGWGDFAFNSGQISRNNNVVKCGYNKTKNGISNELSMQEIKYKGNDGILSNHVKTVSPIDYNNLENIIPGFSFLNGPCNPCVSLNNPPNYNCPFNLELRGSKKGVSPVWKYLWKL